MDSPGEGVETDREALLSESGACLGIKSFSSIEATFPTFEFMSLEIVFESPVTALSSLSSEETTTQEFQLVRLHCHLNHREQHQISTSHCLSRAIAECPQV